MEYFLTDLSTLKARRKMKFEVKNRTILLAYTDNGVFAVQDKCPHRGASLYPGLYEDGVIICKDHGLKISVETGEVTDLQKAEFLKFDEYSMNVKTFKVIVKEDLIYLDI